MKEKNADFHLKKQIIKDLFLGLFLPLMVLLFYFYATSWESYKIHQEIDESIGASQNLTADQKSNEMAYFDKLDLQEVALNPTPSEKRLHAHFEQDGLDTTYRLLHWGYLLSVVLICIIGFALFLIVLLNFLAEKSQGMLISSYKIGWAVVMLAVSIKWVLLIPLLTYGCFEFTVLLSNHYYPKLLIFIVLAGVGVLWKILTIIFKKIPMEFYEPLSRALKPEEAPELWQAVRSAAGKLETDPPDNIIIGMKFNFYVTELSVITDSGRLEGKSLFLCYPVIKQLSTDEVMGIIGHELGHFRGRDTQLSREFYPLKYKIDETMIIWIKAGLTLLPTLGFMRFFILCFEKTIQKASRAREFLADQVGASITSGQTLGRALVKFQILADTLPKCLSDPAVLKMENPMDVNWRGFIAEKIPAHDPFWKEVFDQHSPHPLDTHPPLQERLEALGAKKTLSDAREVALIEEQSAYEGWFSERGQLFADLVEKTRNVLTQNQARAAIVNADLNSDSGRELLLKHFPEITWKRKMAPIWWSVSFLGLLVIVSLGLTIFVPQIPWKVFWAVICGLFVIWMNWVWKGRNSTMVLNAESLQHSSWTRPLHLKDISRISIVVNYSQYTMTLNLKEKQKPFQKWYLLPATYAVSMGISHWSDKPLVIANTINRYSQRQIPPS